MTFVSITTITAALLLISGVFIGLMNVDGILKRASEQAGIVAYLNEKASTDTTLQTSLLDTIMKMPGVRDVGFISKDSARGRFEEMYGREMLEAVDGNPLPASFDIFLVESGKPDAAAELREMLAPLDGIESVDYSGDWLERLKRLRDLFYVIASVAGLVILLALHATISNTIRLTIYARRDLVRNMHYVGATDTFIRMPFLLEGMLQGFIGGLLCICMMSAARFLLSRFILPDIAVEFNWYFSYLPFTVVIGVFFGWLGSRFAVRKFLV
jgi:cell division transport system permease protein